MIELVGGLAPNLKEVIIQNIMSYRSSRDRCARESWHGLPGFTGGEAAGFLKLLSITRSMDLDTPKLLQNWARHTDFACLQHLSLG